MRSTKRPKAHKKPSRHERIHKKRHKNTSNRSWGWKDDLSGLFIDDINEAIRTKKRYYGAYDITELFQNFFFFCLLKKSRRTEGKGCWKLVPKDSCEVYKDRKKRSAAPKKPELSSEEMSNDTESRMEEDKKENKKKLRKKYTKKNIQGKKYQSKNKGKKRSRSYSVSACSSTSLSTCYTDQSHMDNCYY